MGTQQKWRNQASQRREQPMEGTKSFFWERGRKGIPRSGNSSQGQEGSISSPLYSGGGQNFDVAGKGL